MGMPKMEKAGLRFHFMNKFKKTNLQIFDPGFIRLRLSTAVADAVLLFLHARDNGQHCRMRIISQHSTEKTIR
jgi:hypothetical protein